MSDEAAGTFSLEPQDVARSAYHAYRAAGGERAAGEWEGLSLDRQALFLRLAKFGGGELAMLEGKPYSHAGGKLRQLATGAEEPVSPRECLAWEAVARHLTTLLDADDVTDLSALELSWGEWAGRKAPELQSA